MSDSVVQKWKEDALLVSKYKLKTIPLIKIAYDRAAEHAECARLVGPKLDKLLDLRSHLKSDTGFVFPDILPREEEQSVNIMPPPLPLLLLRFLFKLLSFPKPAAPAPPNPLVPGGG